MKFKNRKEWFVHSKIEKFDKFKYPATPQQVYADNGWKGWDDFLGKK